MENDKCPFCGAEENRIDKNRSAHNKYSCGTDVAGARTYQSERCKLIVRHRELEERHRRLVEAAAYAIETHECFKGKVTYCDCSICKLRKALSDETAG